MPANTLPAGGSTHGLHSLVSWWGPPLLLGCFFWQQCVPQRSLLRETLQMLQSTLHVLADTGNFLENFTALHRPHYLQVGRQKWRRAVQLTSLALTTGGSAHVGTSRAFDIALSQTGATGVVEKSIASAVFQTQMECTTMLLVRTAFQMNL